MVRCPARLGVHPTAAVAHSTSQQSTGSLGPAPLAVMARTAIHGCAPSRMVGRGVKAMHCSDSRCQAPPGEGQPTLHVWGKAIRNADCNAGNAVPGQSLALFHGGEVRFRSGANTVRWSGERRTPAGVHAGPRRFAPVAKPNWPKLEGRGRAGGDGHDAGPLPPTAPAALFNRILRVSHSSSTAIATLRAYPFLDKVAGIVIVPFRAHVFRCPVVSGFMTDP